MLQGGRLEEVEVRPWQTMLMKYFLCEMACLLPQV